MNVPTVAIPYRKASGRPISDPTSAGNTFSTLPSSDSLTGDTEIYRRCGSSNGISRTWLCHQLQSFPHSVRSGNEYPVFAYQILTPADKGSSGFRLIFRSNGSSTWNAPVRALLNGGQDPGNSLWTLMFSGSNFRLVAG